MRLISILEANPFRVGEVYTNVIRRLGDEHGIGILRDEEEKVWR